ncbi:hypothetical protein LP418_05305 [Nocardioides sp. B-3]|nr:4-hydroxyphenylacetate 3-hydroxylase N-terminal domain-containing protein [Nocardioides sp. B-3]UUZ60337.1 hypothetical protein LP418_05305 [Nocardioides sp. B-3]
MTQIDDHTEVELKAPEPATATPTSAPMTGDEYIDSLKDDREIWIYGERVKDVTEHPAFRNPIRMTARLYNSLHDEQLKKDLWVPTDTGSGGWTHPFFKTPKTTEDLQADRKAIEHWSRQTWGWMGRSPDYKGSFLGTLGGYPEFYAPYEENAKRWYKESRGEGPLLEPRDHQPAGRPKPAAGRGGRRLHEGREGDGRRRDRLRRQGRGDRFGDHQLQLHRALRAPDQEEGVRPRCARSRWTLPA